MYVPRREATRRAMEDSTASLQKLNLEEYQNDLDAIEAMLNKVARQATLTKRSFQEIDKAVAILSERIKWIWWVVGGMLAVMAYMAKELLTWGLGKF